MYPRGLVLFGRIETSCSLAEVKRCFLAVRYHNAVYSNRAVYRNSAVQARNLAVTPLTKTWTMLRGFPHFVGTRDRVRGVYTERDQVRQALAKLQGEQGRNHCAYRVPTRSKKLIFINIDLNFIIRAIERDGYCRPIANADDTSLLFEVTVSDRKICDLGSVEKRAISHFYWLGLVVDSAKNTVIFLHSPHRNFMTEDSDIEVFGSDSTRAYELDPPPQVRFRKMLCCNSLPSYHD